MIAAFAHAPVGVRESGKEVWEGVIRGWARLICVMLLRGLGQKEVTADGCVLLYVGPGGLTTQRDREALGRRVVWAVGCVRVLAVYHVLCGVGWLGVGGQGWCAAVLAYMSQIY